MNKSFAIPLLAILIWACNSGPERQISFPYKFDRSALDKMVKENKAIHDISKRPDGTLLSETFYLGDTAKYKIDYDKKSNISEVYRFDSHGQAIWMESYYPNGQRKAHYALKAFEEIGPKSVFHGPFQEFHENTNISGEGVYDRNQIMWKVEFDKEGVPGDTMVYDYEAPETPVKDSVKANKKPTVEKINTANTRG